MSADSTDVIDTAPTEPTPEPTPPTEQPPQETQQNEGTDALSQFVAKISQYQNAKEAKKHFKEIAKELGCSTQLGYKALKKVDKFTDKTKPQYREAAVKMKPSEEMPIEQEQPTENNQPGTTYSPNQEPDIIPPIDGDNFKEDLQPIIEHGSAGAVRNILKAVSTKIGGDNGKNYMTTQREKDLGVLLPYVVGKLTKKATLTRDDYINYATLALCGDIATELIADKLTAPQKEKPTFKEEPEPTPAAEQPSQPAQEEKPKAQSAEFDPKNEATWKPAALQ
jgi:hypothetical protein